MLKLILAKDLIFHRVQAYWRARRWRFLCLFLFQVKDRQLLSTDLVWIYIDFTTLVIEDLQKESRVYGRSQQTRRIIFVTVDHNEHWKLGASCATSRRRWTKLIDYIDYFLRVFSIRENQIRLTTHHIQDSETLCYGRKQRTVILYEGVWENLRNLHTQQVVIQVDEVPVKPVKLHGSIKSLLLEDRVEVTVTIRYKNYVIVLDPSFNVLCGVRIFALQLPDLLQNSSKSGEIRVYQVNLSILLSWYDGFGVILEYFGHSLGSEMDDLTSFTVTFICH